MSVGAGVACGLMCGSASAAAAAAAAAVVVVVVVMEEEDDDEAADPPPPLPPAAVPLPPLMKHEGQPRVVYPAAVDVAWRE